VLPAGSSLKMSFKKMSLKVHPDKNSHPGAKDAFKKLNDAFERYLSLFIKHFPE